MANGNNTAGAFGKFLAFLGASVLCGVLVAALFAPTVGFAGLASNESINVFDGMDEGIQLDAPAKSSKILASDGTVIANIFSQNRTPVGSDQIAQPLKDAIVAIEDERFYDHGGIDMPGIVRAMVATATGKREGASTITQQLVNNVLIQTLEAKGKSSEAKLGAQKTILDKVREIKLAIAVDRKYTKDEILTKYLNLVGFANATYGAQAAAQYYWKINAKDLSVAQSALLAGVVNNPTLFDPIKNPKNSQNRRDIVLKKMLDQGKITQEQYTEAVNTPLNAQQNPAPGGCQYAAMAPYFCEYISRLILTDDRYGATQDDRARLLHNGGLTIKTTLDSRLQKTAQDQVNDTQPATDPSLKGTSLTTIEPGTGRVLSMAQNTVYSPDTSKIENTQLNFNTDLRNEGASSGFQPGSTAKVVTFAAWVASGRSPNAYIDASRNVYPANFPWKASCRPPGTYFGDYTGSNYLRNYETNRQYGRMTVQDGLKQSVNTATFATAAQMDLCDIDKMAQAMGLVSTTTDNEDQRVEVNPVIFSNNISSLLGGDQNVSPLVMANGFATFASGGIYCEPIAMESITDPTGKNLPVPGANCRRTIEPGIAATINAGLQAPFSAGGSAQRLGIGTPAGGKTGTTEDSVQTWMVGYTPKLATASWWGWWNMKGVQSGQDYTYKGRFIKTVDGSMIAGPQWQSFMRDAVKYYPAPDGFPSGDPNPKKDDGSSGQQQNSQSGDGG